MLVPGANTGILVSRRNRSSETEHEWPGRQGAGARSGRETGFEKSLSPPKTHKRDTDLPQCFSSGDSGRRASGSPAVCAQVSTGPKMRGARLDHAADDTPAAPQRRRPRRRPRERHSASARCPAPSADAGRLCSALFTINMNDLPAPTPKRPRSAALRRLRAAWSRPPSARTYGGPTPGRSGGSTPGSMGASSTTPIDIELGRHLEPEPPQRHRQVPGVVVQVRQPPDVRVGAVAHHQRHPAVGQNDRRDREHHHGQHRHDERPHRSHPVQLPFTFTGSYLQTSVNRKPNSRTRRIVIFVDSRSEAGRFRARQRDRVSSGLPTFGEVACAASSPRWRRAQWGAGPRHRPAESSCRQCPRDPAARWSPLTLAGIGGSSDKQLLQVIDRGPHLLSVPRRPVVAPRQPRHAVVAACGDQPDRQTLRAVLLRQGQEPPRQCDRRKFVHARSPTAAR